MKYDKPPLSFQDQCELLVKRGLVVRNKQKAIQFLSQKNYYRLSAYYYPFLEDKENHLFYPDASFEKIMRLYFFDCELRRIVAPIVESAEILMRCRVANHLVMKYNDPFCYLRKDIYTKKFVGEQIAAEDFQWDFSEEEMKTIWMLLAELKIIDRKGNIKKNDLNEILAHFNPEQVAKIKKILNFSAYDIWMSKMKNSIRESKEEFVRHYLEKYYEDSSGFPLWMVTEIISFGQLSKLLAGLNSEDRQLIADQYGLPHRILTDWLHSVVYLRNTCAHHLRLWNRKLEIRPTKPRDLPERDVWTERMFPLLVVLKYLTPQDFNWSAVVRRLRWLFFKNPFVDSKAMGFPKDWVKILLRK